MKPWILWPAFVGFIALTSLSGATWLIVSAHSDECFAVEPDYYAKAVRWDDTARQARENARLGWTISLDQRDRQLFATVRRSDGSPITAAEVRAVAFAHVRAAERCDLRFVPSSLHNLGGMGVPPVPTPSTTYKASFVPQHAGLWRFRFEVLAENQRFTAEIDQTMLAAGAEHAP